MSIIHLQYHPGPAKGDNYNQAALAEKNWFNGLDAVVKDIFVWGGGGEVLIDSIDTLTKVLKASHPRVEYLVTPGAAHDEFILEKVLGYQKKAEATEAIESWMKARM
jgi:acetyl esterase/lipase